MFSKEVSAALFTQISTGITISIFMTYFGIYLKDLQTTALIIAVIFASRNFLQIFIRIPLSELSQVIGRKPLIIAGVVLYTLALFILFIATDWQLILVATILISIGMASYYPAVFAYIGDITSKSNNYGRINGILFQGTDIGIIASSFAAKFLIDQMDFDLPDLFLITFYVGIVGVIIAIIILPESIAEEDRKQGERVFSILKNSFLNSFSSLKKMTKRRNLTPIYGFQLIISYSEYFFTSFFPLLLLAKGFGYADVAYIVFIGTIATLVFKPFLGSLSDRFGYRNPVIISLAISIATLLVLTQINASYLIIIVYCVFRMATITQYLAVNGASSKAVPSELRGLTMGLLGVYVSFGRTTSSLILAPVWSILDRTYGDDELSISALFMVSAFLVMIAAYWLVNKTKVEHDQ